VTLLFFYQSISIPSPLSPWERDGVSA
jgi:hypothetical protein